MNLFVADRIPKVPDLVLSFSSAALQGAGRCRRRCRSSSRKYADYTDVDKARAEFKKDNSRVRLLMDNGAAIAGHPEPSVPAGRWTTTPGRSRRPRPVTFYFGSKGKLNQKNSKKGKQASYVADPSARPAQTLTGAG